MSEWFGETCVGGKICSVSKKREEEREINRKRKSIFFLVWLLKISSSIGTIDVGSWHLIQHSEPPMEAVRLRWSPDQRLRSAREGFR